jgi:hypothetical protein
MTLLKCLADFSEDNEIAISEKAFDKEVSFDEMAAELYDKYVEDYYDTEI